MAQTIRYEIGEQAHVIVISGGRVTTQWAMEHICNVLDAPLVDFEPTGARPSILEQLSSRLKHAGVTYFKIIEQ